MTALYDQAKLMARELQDTQEFADLSRALAKVREDPESNNAFTEFQAAQREIQRLQEQGQEPKPEQIQSWQSTAQKAQELQPIKDLSALEQNLNNMLGEVNELITAPLNALYSKK
ncbi:YlbF family regulator [Oenococcus kitaharae]|uniref:YlbF family regulator n=1 Tax=Oenococcus TaxID=46254 RepID=UPI0021E96B38|nr:YlbF family regulator [Oenococcus kitaharae]MCV3295701.1 YlbF family regulator [Oenococcus kitaharae]